MSDTRPSCTNTGNLFIESNDGKLICSYVHDTVLPLEDMIAELPFAVVNCCLAIAMVLCTEKQQVSRFHCYNENGNNYLVTAYLRLAELECQ